MPKTIAPLSPKERQFVAEYLVDKNGSAASARAGYTCKDHRHNAFELLRRPRVKAAITRELKAQQKRTLITADQNLLDIQNIGSDAWAAKEFSSALRSRELIGKHFRQFTDKVELTGANDGPVEFTSITRTIVDPAAAPK